MGGFLFLLAVCVLWLCYVIAARLRQGILGGTLAFATGYGLLMTHLMFEVYIIPTSWERYLPFVVWSAILVLCDLFLAAVAGFIPWGIRRWFLYRRARPRL